LTRPGGWQAVTDSTVGDSTFSARQSSLPWLESFARRDFFLCRALSVFAPTSRQKSAEMAIEKKVRILVPTGVMLFD